MPDTPTFTAAQIAAALGRPDRSIRRLLTSTPPNRCAVVAGRAVAAWSLASLPAALRAELSAIAQRRGYASEQSTLADPAPTSLWQPPIPLEEIHPDELANAAKLRRVLGRALQGRHNPDFTSAQLEEMALADFKRNPPEGFGYSITTRSIRFLLKRTVERDNNADDFFRLDIYLHGNPRRAPSAPRPLPAVEDVPEEYQELRSCLAEFKDPTKPTRVQRAAIWDKAITLFKRRLIGGEEPRQARLRLLNWLWNSSPCLARNPKALRNTFDRRWEWERQRRSQSDGRLARKGIPVKPPPSPELRADLAIETKKTGSMVKASENLRGKYSDEELGIAPELDAELARAMNSPLAKRSDSAVSISRRPLAAVPAPQPPRQITPATETVPLLELHP